MEITPTRSALLEAKDERHVMGEGFRFLDEKRLLLAAEMMRLLERYQKLDQSFREIHGEAISALADGVQRHGLEGVQVQPAQTNDDTTIIQSERRFFGVRLVEAEDHPGEVEHPPAVNPSPEVAACREGYEKALAKLSELAVLSGNLRRLLYEYKRTERRARALEDVILPELDGAIHEMDQRLEEMEQEESVRVRLPGMESAHL
ncbi:MAG: V-type ATP synthase subunit D [Magnetococcales bacterium]|nr:V-type ATP synthase subunit D [Magnetococcales bacterium]